MSQHFIALVKRGDTKEISELVKAEPAIAQSRDAQGVSALLWSIYTGQTTIRDFLLSGLEHLDIFEAAAAGDPAQLESLLTGNPSLATAVSSDGWTPLHLAAAFGTPEAVECLLRHGARVDQISQTAMRNQPLHAALALNSNAQVIKILVDHGADPNATQTGGLTPLHQAASAGKLEQARILLEHGALAAIACDRGRTASDYAREKGHSDLLSLLERHQG